MISVKHRGSFRNLEKFFDKAKRNDYYHFLEKFGRLGADILSANTPEDTGKTANSWSFEIVRERNRSTIYWLNSNVNNGVNIALVLQYGHGTNNGGYVEGLDYINPALRPVFTELAEQAWKEVTSS